MMKPTNSNRKRPCLICDKWFKPDPRIGERQWHAEKCRDWNRKNIPYFQEIFLERCLASVVTSDGEATTKSSNEVTLASLPVPVVQEVLSIQQSGNQHHSSTVPALVTTQ